MRKYGTALLFCLLTFLFCSCAQVQIDCGVAEDASAYMNICLEMNLTETDQNISRMLKEKIDELADYYESKLGYDVIDGSQETDTDTIRLYMTKARKEENIPAAFDALKEMLTDQASPFSELSMWRNDGTDVQGYTITGTIDACGMLRQTDISSFPNQIREYIEKSIEESHAAIQITLPATEIINASAQTEIKNGFATIDTPISLTEETELFLLTEARFKDQKVLSNEAAERQWKDMQERQEILFWTVCGTGILIIFLIVLLIIFFIKSKYKRNTASNKLR